MAISAGPTDHRPVDPSIGFRFDHEGTAVVVAGDTVPCAGLDELCAGSDALVHTVIRKDIIADIPIQRTTGHARLPLLASRGRPDRARAGVGTLVLTHYVPAIPSGGGDDWRRSPRHTSPGASSSATTCTASRSNTDAPEDLPRSLPDQIQLIGRIDAVCAARPSRPFVVEDVGRTVGSVGHLPHGAVGTGPGDDPVGRHRQCPATLVHQVMVVLTER